MKYDLTGSVVIEARLLRELQVANAMFLRLPVGSVQQLDLGVKISVLVEALDAVHLANDAVERVNLVVVGVKHG